MEKPVTDMLPEGSSHNEPVYLDCAGLISRGFGKEAIRKLSSYLSLPRQQASAVVARIRHMVDNKLPIDAVQLDEEVRRLKETRRFPAARLRWIIIVVASAICFAVVTQTALILDKLPSDVFRLLIISGMGLAFIIVVLLFLMRIK
jgi:hypothetical protein